ncbi:hypothetical protein [Methanopyrus kandleri]
MTCVQALTTALSAHAIRRALREGPHPGVPLEVSTAVSGLCTVIVALAFCWGLRVTHGAVAPSGVLPGLISTLKPAFVLAVDLSLGLYWTTFASRSRVPRRRDGTDADHDQGVRPVPALRGVPGRAPDAVRPMGDPAGVADP